MAKSEKPKVRDMSRFSWKPGDVEVVKAKKVEPAEQAEPEFREL